MVNLPRALFTNRTGREPRYHVAIEELQDWTYVDGRLAPLKGYPGIVRERPKSRRSHRNVDEMRALAGGSLRSGSRSVGFDNADF